MSTLVRFVVNTRYEDLSPEVIEYAKKHILDTLGIIVAATSTDGIKPAVDLARRWGGAPESSIPVFGGKVPAPSAAFAIGPMARALDFGGVHPDANEHTTEYVLPVALPVAEQHRLSGKDLITAVVLGNEVIVRTGASVHTLVPVSMTKTHSVFRIWGPVAAVGKLLRLDEETMTNAMGLAYTQGGCDAQMFVDCVLKCRVQHGFVADTAIKCVLLAQEGVTGTQNMLEGEKGFYAAFFPEHNLKWITDGLEERRFETVKTRIKAYPVCTYAQSSIDAALCCARENSIKPQDVAEINVGVNTPSYEAVCTPPEFRYNPRTFVDAQFSIPYTVATAIATGKVFIEDFNEEAIRRPEIRQLMQKLKVNIDPEIEAADPLGFAGAKVRIRTKDGHEYSKHVVHAKGTPENPMSFDEVVDKFRRCMPFSIRPIPQKNVDRLVDLVRSLEEVDDASVLVEQLAA